MELLPWDCWGLMEYDFEAHSDDDLALLDQVATLTLSDEISFPKIRSIYKTNKGLRVPPIISSFTGAKKGFQKVDISEDCASFSL